MAKKHQVKVSSKKGRTKAGRKDRRQESQSLREMARGGRKGFRQERRGR